jgi:hypothetical protein
MLRFVLFSFLTLPLQNFRIAENAEFNNELHNVLCTIGTLVYFVPKIMKNNEICEKDDDCPLIMRCCQVGIKKYCCTPNNFVKMDLAYQEKKIESDLHATS